MKSAKPRSSWFAPTDSRPLAVLHRLAQLPMLGGIDEGQDFRNRRLRSREMPDLIEAVGQCGGPVKQLLIERSHDREALAGEFPAFQADGIEARQRRERAARQRER